VGELSFLSGLSIPSGREKGNRDSFLGAKVFVPRKMFVGKGSKKGISCKDAKTAKNCKVFLDPKTKEAGS
jgi:hypothetical protein